MKLSGQSQAVLLQAGLIAVVLVAVAMMARKAVTEAGAVVSQGVSDLVDTVIGAPGAILDSAVEVVQGRVEAARTAEELLEDWSEWNSN